jgi:hypothetical protein
MRFSEAEPDARAFTLDPSELRAKPITSVPEESFAREAFVVAGVCGSLAASSTLSELAPPPQATETSARSDTLTSDLERAKITFMLTSGNAIEHPEKPVLPDVSAPSAEGGRTLGKEYNP